MTMMLLNKSLDTATSNGVAMELFPIVQAPINIDVDENNMEDWSCKPDPVTSSNNVASVTGVHKTFFTSPRGSPYEQGRAINESSRERYVHHCISSEQPSSNPSRS